MRYQTEITALQILATTTVTVNLQERHDEEGETYINRQTLVYHVDDLEECNPRAWLRDALMYVAENL